MRLLEFILDVLLPPRTTSTLVRRMTTETLPAQLTPKHFSYEHGIMTGLLCYRHEQVRACILEAKFHTNAHASTLLGTVLGTYLRTLEDPALILVPVPLGERRRRARGHNQAERICVAALPSLADTTCLAPDILIRVRETLPQTELSGNARRENVRGAFSVSEPLDHGRTYVVIDDVTTTGATLSAACDALRAAGARRIVAIALAY